MAITKTMVLPARIGSSKTRLYACLVKINVIDCAWQM